MRRRKGLRIEEIESFPKLGDVVIDAFSDRIKRNFLNFIDDVSQLLLQLAQTARSGWYRQRSVLFVKSYSGSMRNKIERYVKLSGKQISRTGLRSQSVFHHGSDKGCHLQIGRAHV